MEITIKSDGRKVSVEVTAEVGEFWEQSRRKARNLQQEQQRHWDGRGYDEYIAATEGRLSDTDREKLDRIIVQFSH